MKAKSTLAGIRSIEDFDLKDQRVFLRLDLNVPIKNGKIADTTRIDAVLPTIRYALEHGAKLVVASHLGRPELNPEGTAPTQESRAKYSHEAGVRQHVLFGEIRAQPKFRLHTISALGQQP